MNGPDGAKRTSAHHSTGRTPGIKNQLKTNMMEHEERKEKLTITGVLGAPVVGDGPIIVSGGPSSSSDVGPSGEWIAGSPLELATVDNMIDVGGATAIMEMKVGDTPVKLPPNTGEEEMEIVPDSRKRKKEADSGSVDQEIHRPNYNRRGERNRRIFQSDTEDEDVTENQVESQILSTDTLKGDVNSEEMVNSQCSDGEDKKTVQSKKGPGRPLKRKNRAGIKDTPELMEVLRGTPENYGSTEFHNMTAAGIGILAMEWIEEINVVQVKSNKLQGRLSGKMEGHIIGVRNAVRTLVCKAEAVRDPGFWRARHSSIPRSKEGRE